MPDDQSYKIKISPVRVVLLLLVLAAIYYLIPQLGEFDKTINILQHSSWIWVIMAIVAMGLTFLIGAIIQYFAGNSIGEIPDLVRLGFAGSFLDHFLPFSVGGIGLIAKYYRKLGQQRSYALVMAIIPTAVGAVTTILIVLVISPITIIEIVNNLGADYRSRLATVVIIVFTIIIAIALLFYRKKLKELFDEVILGLKSVQSFQQLAKVAGGSIILTLIASFVLYASIQAVHGHLSFIIVVAIFIVSLLTSEAAPTPGGLGATEAVLIIGLSGAGLTASQALSATLIFRFISFLLPLLPGIVAISQLNRPAKH